MALLAQISAARSTGDERAAHRRALRLRVPTTSAADAADALVHDLSELGLLLETEIPLDVGERLDVELPETGPVSAWVVWSRGRLFGCSFSQPVTKASVSAALLRSPAGPSELSVGQMIPPVEWPQRQDSERQIPLSAEPPIVRLIAIVGLTIALVAVLIFLSALLAFPISIK